MQPGMWSGQGNGEAAGGHQHSRPASRPVSRTTPGGQRGMAPGSPNFELPALPGVPPQNLDADAMTGRRPDVANMPALGMPGGQGQYENARLPSPITPAVAASLGRVSGMARPSAGPMSQSAPMPAEAGLPPRAPTLTQQMRSIQPPDVARQAMSELGVLARELATLPDELENAGLARTHQRSYFEAAKAYLGLARQAWESVAEERLEQSGAEPEYRQRAIAVARRVSQLQQECRTAQSNESFQLPRRVPTGWRRRVSLVRTGLLAWQERLTPTPSPLDMGRGLFRLRGYLGLALAGSLELALLGLLTGGALVLVALLGLGILLLAAATLLGGGGVVAAALGLAVLGIALVEALLAQLTVRGPAPLELLLGAAIYSPTRSTRNGRNGHPLLAALLRVWWLLLGSAALLALLTGLAMGGALIGEQLPLAAPQSAIQGLALAGSVLAVVVAPAAAVSVAGLVALGLPVLLVTLVRCGAEVAENPAWVPVARRYALDPALAVLATVTCVATAAAWVAATGAQWQAYTLFTLRLGGLQGAVTGRGVALFFALALPYLLFLEWPYRLGMRRWRRAWLNDLAARRADVESHIRRLSVSDPQSGIQDTSEENLRAMQYDLVLLQFYQSKIEEAQRTSRAPFRLPAYLLSLAIAVAGALLLEAASGTLLPLLLAR